MLPFMWGIPSKRGEVCLLPLHSRMLLGLSLIMPVVRDEVRFTFHFMDIKSPSPLGEALGVVIWSRADLPE